MHTIQNFSSSRSLSIQFNYFMVLTIFTFRFVMSACRVTGVQTLLILKIDTFKMIHADNV